MHVTVRQTGKGDPSTEIDYLGGRDHGRPQVVRVAQRAHPLTADGDRPDGTVAACYEGCVCQDPIRRQSAVGVQIVGFVDYRLLVEIVDLVEQVIYHVVAHVDLL